MRQCRPNFYYLSIDKHGKPWKIAIYILASSYSKTMTAATLLNEDFTTGMITNPLVLIFAYDGVCETLPHGAGKALAKFAGRLPRLSTLHGTLI